MTLTLDEALDIARTHETTTQHLLCLTQNADQTETDHIQRRGPPQTRPPTETYKPDTNSHNTQCRNCGGTHTFQNRSTCPAYGTVCKHCGKPNHWENSCRSKRRQEFMSARRGRPEYRFGTPQHDKSLSKRRFQHNVHQVQNYGYTDPEPLADEVEHFSLQSIQVQTINPGEGDTRDEVFAHIHLTPPSKSRKKIIDLKCKVDTGAQGQYTSPETIQTNISIMSHSGRHAQIRLFTTFKGKAICIRGDTN